MKFKDLRLGMSVGVKLSSKRERALSTSDMKSSLWFKGELICIGKIVGFGNGYYGNFVEVQLWNDVLIINNVEQDLISLDEGFNKKRMWEESNISMNCRCVIEPIKEKRMREFDKSKILTPITVDQFVGEQLGWADDDVEWLEYSVRKEKPQLVTQDKSEIDYPFKIGDSSFRYFYPVPEPTYAERQAQWVKENNVKAGTKVRITRTFTEDDVVRYDMCERVFDDVKEKLASVGFELLHLSSTERGKDFDVILLTTIVKHPLLKEEYVPFTGDELNELVGKVLVNKQSGRKKLVTGKPTASNGINLDGDYFSAKDLLANFTLNGNPCGGKV